MFFVFPVSDLTSSMATQNQACLAAFGMCRKYQDKAGEAIATCDQSAIRLASKLKSLTKNKAKVNQAQAVIGQLVARHLAGGEVNIILRQQEAGLGCSDIIVFTNSLKEALEDNPASQAIGRLAELIVNASNVVCTNQELAFLTALDGNINKTEVLIDIEAESTQATLEGKSIKFVYLIRTKLNLNN